VSFIDDARKWATMPVPGAREADQHQKLLDAMPVEELASTWRALQHVGVRDRTEGTWATTLYFDRLPHDAPERAYAMVLEVLRTEFDKSVLMQLNNKLMLVLVGDPHGATLIERMEADARTMPQLRWLIGGCAWWGGDEDIKARLRAIGDTQAWRADRDARDEPALRIDFEALSTPALARAWVEQNFKLDKDRDDNWSALFDYQCELVNHEPDKAIDLILEILKIEGSEPLHPLLAAGLLEDAIGRNTIDRIEREAAANHKFRDLLGGVWYWNEPEDLKTRLDAIVKGQHW
jgi:hypothetical protein